MILFISCSIGIPTIDASRQRITGPRRATRSCSSNIHISAVTVKVNVPRLPHFLACLTSSALRLLLVPMIRAHATTPSPTMTANRRFSRKLSANHAPCNCNSEPRIYGDRVKFVLIWKKKNLQTTSLINTK